VLSNPHLSHCYELYYKAFERFRRVPEIHTLDDNDRFCAILKEMLETHLSVIPRLAIGVLEVQGTMAPDATDKFMLTLLKSRISRRVIAEQHLALTETFHSPWHFPDAQMSQEHDADFVGEIFLRCNAKEIVERCAETTRELMRTTYGSDCAVPDIKIVGEPDATFPYIQSHLEYIVSELLRNSMQALVEQRRKEGERPAPIEVLICETPQHVIFRFSDEAGGIPKDILPYLWSFSKGPRRTTKLKNLRRVPRMAATMQELHTTTSPADAAGKHFSLQTTANDRSSLSSLTSRPPNLRLGIGLPMSRVYAEYWTGSLEIHSLEGYGTDAFLQVSKLGNKNEQLLTRATMDAI
jgi:pyruvate dehydrogenase kinase 2/3/4